MLVGCDSRAAAAIGARIQSVPVIGIGRRDGAGTRVRVDDYAEVPADLALAGATIVNCVGTDRGSPGELQRLNVEVPQAWARAARAAGARQFVQISSFSVYGRTERIDRATPLLPASDYGRSKLAAERQLAEETLDAGLRLTILRVPILLAAAGDGGRPDKLAQLIGLIKRTHVVPRPAQPVERSMISYDGLAAAVERVIADTPPIACAADPEPFTYDLAAAIARDQGTTLLSLPVPTAAASFARKIAPGINDRLFASSLLSTSDNILTDRGDYLRLRDIIASHFG